MDEPEIVTRVIHKARALLINNDHVTCPEHKMKEMASLYVCGVKALLAHGGRIEDLNVESRIGTYANLVFQQMSKLDLKLSLKPHFCHYSASARVP